MNRHVVTAALLALFTSALSAQSQRADTHGITIDVGAGGGLAGVTCHGCIATNSNGPSGFIQVGYELRPALSLGVEYDGWTQVQYGERTRFDYYTIVGQAYASALSSLYFKGGLGYGRTTFRQWDVSDAPYTTQRSGLAYQLGVGYDLRVNEALAISPYVQILSTRAGPARVDGVRSDLGHLANVLQYGLAMRLR